MLNAPSQTIIAANIHYISRNAVDSVVLELL
jgi:hypothetical protein